MRRFEFRLDGLARLREQQRRAALRALGEAQRHSARQARELGALAREHAAAHGALARLRAPGTLDLFAVRLQEQYVRAVERAIDRAREALRKRLEDEQAARAAYVEARRRVRVLERLRERRLAEWRAEADREERMALDEVAIAVRGKETSA
jgi:flagellar FliJ protein